MEALEFKVEKETAGIRIDRFLADKCGDVSRSYLQKLLEGTADYSQSESCQSKP